jgi:hypothetical protein
VSLWCPGRADAAPEEWKVLQESTYGGTFSYDVVSVKHTERNTVTVWARADAARYLYEIDCKNKKARILQGAGPSAAEWFPVTGGSADELLFHAVCPQLFP